MQPHSRGPIKVPVRDKRRVVAEQEEIKEKAPASAGASPGADDPDAPEVAAELGAAGEDAGVSEAAAGAPEAGADGDGAPEVVEGEVVQPDYLDDLRRLQADFDNFRKRMMKQQAEEAARGVARLVERLLPVLDNFERAVAHGEGGEGVQLVFKELKAVLEAEGLVEVPAEGAPFDPQIHEAVESSEDESVGEPMVRSVYRRGYALNGRLLRPAMVGVAHPAERREPAEPQRTADDEHPAEREQAAQSSESAEG